LGMGMWKDAVLDRRLAVTGGGRTIRTYASASNDRSEIAVVVINKLMLEQPVSIHLKGLSGTSIYQSRTLAGLNAQDPAPLLTESTITHLKENTLQFTAAPCSITTITVRTGR
jgi:hypothetical protein